MFFGGTAALACSCVAPSSPAQSREFARSAVEHAVAIVEIRVLSAYDARSQRGERVQVRRVLWGRAPNRFELERGPSPSSASCDLLFRAGERRYMILYPAERRTRGGPARFRPHGLCTDHLVQAPGHRAILLEEARRRSRG